MRYKGYGFLCGHLNFYFHGTKLLPRMKGILLSFAMVTALTAGSQTLTIHFDFNKYTLDKRSKFLIDSFMAVTDPDGKIELAGHCDFIGSNGYNDALSRRRVVAVKNYIEENYVVDGGVSTTDAFGERKPLNANKTDEARQVNRRVEIRIFSPKNTTLKEKIADTATTVGSSITLRNINFVGGRHIFLEESYPMLQELLDAMRTYPKLVIEIHGHICCQPYANDGLDLDTRTNNLSEERAKAVYEHLIANGIAPNRLSYKGFGHSLPIYPYPEQSEEERTQNRRVEIKIISK